MVDYKKISQKHSEKLKKAIQHLKYSFNKVQLLSTDVLQLNEDQLADWESFIARFSRASDIYFMKYLRTKILIQDPGFHGSFIDSLNQAEKLNLIDHAEPWLEMRDLRNTAAHEYDDENLEELFIKVKKLAPLLIQLEKKLNAFEE